MKATHLEQIAQDYERAKEHQHIMNAGIDKKLAVSSYYHRLSGCHGSAFCCYWCSLPLSLSPFTLTQYIPELERQAKELEEKVC